MFEALGKTCGKHRHLDPCWFSLGSLKPPTKMVLAQNDASFDFKALDIKFLSAPLPEPTGEARRAAGSVKDAPQ